VDLPDGKGTVSSSDSCRSHSYGYFLLVIIFFLSGGRSENNCQKQIAVFNVSVGVGILLFGNALGEERCNINMGDSRRCK